jgi:hypothetical protein
MEKPEDRPLAEDISCPVVVEPGVDSATPEGWEWRRIGTSQPNQATFYINHSDVTRVKVGMLRPSDFPPEAPFVLTREVPIIIIDSLDKFWAGESRTSLPLHGLRVPVEGDTEEEAKRNLAADLAAQLRLLLLLATSRQGEIAPQLKDNLVYLRSIMAPAQDVRKQQG